MFYRGMAPEETLVKGHGPAHRKTRVFAVTDAVRDHSSKLMTGHEARGTQGDQSLSCDLLTAVTDLLGECMIIFCTQEGGEAMGRHLSGSSV